MSTKEEAAKEEARVHKLRNEQHDKFADRNKKPISGNANSPNNRGEYVENAKEVAEQFRKDNDLDKEKK